MPAPPMAGPASPNGGVCPVVLRWSLPPQNFPFQHLDIYCGTKPPYEKKSYPDFYILIFYAAQADTFIVTSNADSGPGTLREAIGFANANGTAVTDYIHFNIVDLSEAGRTINLQSELPTLTSNITLDGTTQPGTKLGISNARITLYLDRYTNFPFTFLFIKDASAVSIYGICFKFFDDPDGGGGLNYAIGLRNASQVTVG
jgi:hypothetical protein